MRNELLKILGGFFLAVLLTMALLAILVMASGCSSTRKAMPLPSENMHAVDSSGSARLTEVLAALAQRGISQQTVRLARFERVILDEKGDTRGHYVNEKSESELLLERENFLLLQRIDSLQRASIHNDTVKIREPYPVDRPVEVERPLAWWRSCLIWIGGISLCAVLLIIGISIGKFIIKRKL